MSADLLDHGIMDKINSVIEFSILIPFAFDCMKIIRVGSSESISLGSQISYLIYCLWVTAYCWTLEQPFSTGMGLAWSAAYAIKIVVAIRYRPVSR